jgi:hypothetical protein
VRAEVLGGGQHLVGRAGEGLALEAAHRRHPQPGDQVGVLAVGLLGAAPARVAGHIQHRREDVVRPARPHLPGGGAEDALVQVRVPGAGQADRLGEAGGLIRHEAVEPLPDAQGRDAQAGLLTEEFLGGVEEAHCFPCSARPLAGVDVGHAVHPVLAGQFGREGLALRQAGGADQLGAFFG